MRWMRGGVDGHAGLAKRLEPMLRLSARKLVEVGVETGPRIQLEDQMAIVDVSDVPLEVRLAAQRYYGGDWSQRRKITVETFSEDSETEWSLDEFLSLVTANIPEEYRAEAIVNFELGYEGGASLTVSYKRDETDDEVNARIEEALAYGRRVVRKDAEKERRTYEALKAKFEKGPT